MGLLSFFYARGWWCMAFWAKNASSLLTRAASLSHGTRCAQTTVAPDGLQHCSLIGSPLIRPEGHTPPAALKTLKEPILHQELYRQDYGAAYQCLRQEAESEPCSGYSYYEGQRTCQR